MKVTGVDEYDLSFRRIEVEHQSITYSLKIIDAFHPRRSLFLVTITPYPTVPRCGGRQLQNLPSFLLLSPSGGGGRGGLGGLDLIWYAGLPFVL